jgi:imidazolonepropionase-like amidohydrolase
MSRSVSALLFLLPAMLLAGPSAAGLAGQTIVILNGRVITGTGDVHEQGTVIIRAGRIAAVGGALPVPADAELIDAAGRTVTAGLLDSSTRLGLTEIGAYPGTVDAVSQDDRVTAAFNVIDGLNPFASPIAVTRVEGITRAVVAPGFGRYLIAGQGALIDLAADRAADMVTRSPVAMYAAIDESAVQRLGGGARGVALMRLREALQDARDYGANRRAFEAAQRRDYALSRLDLEALLPVVRGELPLALHVDRAADILAALRLRGEFGLRLVLLGAEEGWRVAEDIARAGVPVVLNPFSNIPGFDALGSTLENPARLHEAGVRIAFGSFDAHNSRTIKQGAGLAVANGLPHEAALAALTSVPAAIWGVADRYGTLEAGKEADVVIWTGDPLELTTRVERVFVRGRQIPPDTRQRELLERYRRLDRATPPAYRP